MFACRLRDSPSTFSTHNKINRTGIWSSDETGNLPWATFILLAFAPSFCGGTRRASRLHAQQRSKGTGPQKPNRIKNCYSTPLLPMPQPWWRVVHQSPQIQRSLPPVPPPSSAVGGARPPGPFGWVFGFSLTSTQTFSCAGRVSVCLKSKSRMGLLAK